MFTRVSGIVAASVLLVSLAGCSIAGGTTTSTGKSGSPAPAASARTYTAADLTAILTAVKKSTGSDGEIISNDKLESVIGKSSSVSALLDQKGIDIEPASCAKLIEANLPSSTNGYGLGDKAIGAALISGTSSVVSVSSVDGAQLPASALEKINSGTDTLLTSCPEMTMKFAAAGQSLKIAMTISKVDVTTSGDKTIGLSESIELPAVAGKKSALTVTIVEAVKGNLVVAATDPVGGGTAADLAKTVDQVLKAAAALK